jgi:hypothetical protein
MCSHTCAPSAPGPTPTDWTHLDLTHGDRNCSVHRFMAPNPTKELEAPQHTHILLVQTKQCNTYIIPRKNANLYHQINYFNCGIDQAQLLNQNLNKRLNVLRIINSYTTVLTISCELENTTDCGRLENITFLINRIRQKATFQNSIRG